MNVARTFLRFLSLLLVLAMQHRSGAQNTAPSPASAPTVASSSPGPNNTGVETGRPFTREEKVQLATKVLAAPTAARRTQPHHRKVLSVTLPADSETAPPKGRRVARLVVFNYTEGKASSLLVDASSAEVLSEVPIRGRPQASEEEKHDAIRIIRQDPELDRLLQANAILEGGFIVDGPPRSAPRHRFLQVQLLSPDRLHLQRTVTVDLTAGTIASSKAGD